jgi:hypothetical protein
MKRNSLLLQTSEVRRTRKEATLKTRGREREREGSNLFCFLIKESHTALLLFPFLIDSR